MKQDRNKLKRACIFGLACMLAATTVNAAAMVTYAEDGIEAPQEVTYSVGLHSDGNGLITLDGQDGDLRLVGGQSYNFTITPNEGYELDRVFEAKAGDVTGYVKNGVLSYMVPWDDLYFTATFKKLLKKCLRCVG